MAGGGSTEINVAEAIAAAHAMGTGSQGWNDYWSGLMGTISSSEDAFGDDQIGSSLRQGYQPGADQLKPQASGLGGSWSNLSSGAVDAAERVRNQDEINARSLGS